MTDQTAAERIEAYGASRAATLAALFAVRDGEATTDEDGYALDQDDAQQRIDELPLSIEIVRHVKVLFGTGGPADWLDIRLGDDGSVAAVVYHFADWFDHAEQHVRKDSPLWQYAEQVAEVERDMEEARS